MFETLPEPQERRGPRATIFFAVAFAFVAGAYLQRAKYEHWDASAVIFCLIWVMVAVAWTVVAMRLSRQAKAGNSGGGAAVR